MCQKVLQIVLVSLFCVSFLHSLEASHNHHQQKHHHHNNSHPMNDFQIELNNSSSKYSIINSQNPRPSHHQPAPNNWRRTSENGQNSGNDRPVKRVVTKSDPSKHICTEKRTVHVPIKGREVYSKPTRHFINEPCNDQKMCTGTRVIHQTAEREVIRHRIVGKIVQICCPGWETATSVGEGCFKPICQKPCLNGGHCTQPDTCTCGQGFTGKYCERDINECKEHKPCDQSCYNTEGSYYCMCREGFVLHSDRRSCKKISRSNDVDAFEVRDMENDVDYDDLNSRVSNLEKSMTMEAKNSQSVAHDLNKRLQFALDSVATMKVQLQRMEQQQQSIMNRQNQQSTSSHTTHFRPVNPVTDIMFKCRNKSIYCPSY